MSCAFVSIDVVPVNFASTILISVHCKDRFSNSLSSLKIDGPASWHHDLPVTRGYQTVAGEPLVEVLWIGFKQPGDRLYSF